MLVQSSRDLLYLVISFCVLWVTVFLCWMFYYVMRLLKNANEIVEEFRSRLETLTNALDYVRGKVEHMSGLLTAATGGVGGLVKKMVSKKANEWLDTGAETFNSAAKEAVDKAVDATAKKMHKVAKKVRGR